MIDFDYSTAQYWQLTMRAFSFVFVFDTESV